MFSFCSRLRQIPPVLMQYPAQAVKALLAGFKPSLLNTEKVRIPYCPEWSMEALWATIDCVQGKQLFASTLVSFDGGGGVSCPLVPVGHK